MLKIAISPLRRLLHVLMKPTSTRSVSVLMREPETLSSKVLILVWMSFIMHPTSTRKVILPHILSGMACL